MNTKHHLVTILAIMLSLVSADFMSAQNFHYRKGWEYAEIDWERSAFSEWEDGMAAGEMSSTIMVAACYMREYGVGRNVSKGVSIMENLASKNTDVALFAANFWFPILDGDPFFDYSPHAGGQYNMWSMFKWWQEKDLRATNFGLGTNYAKVIKFSKMYLAKGSAGYGANLAKEMIGYCYEKGGNGVSKDLKKALEYYSGLNRFYTLATKLIESAGTLEEMEQEVSKLKPYIKDDDVLSSLESKTWTAGTYDYTDEERKFLKVYFDKNEENVERQAIETATEWWCKNNRDLYENPNRFKDALKAFNPNVLSEIIKYLDREFIKISSTNCVDSLYKLWVVYPCEETTYHKLDTIASKYMQLVNEKIIEKYANDYIKLFSAYRDLLNNNPVISSKVYYSTSFTDDEYFGFQQQFSSYGEYIRSEINFFIGLWERHYEQKLTSESSKSWIWNMKDIPLECQKSNMIIGSLVRDTGRKYYLDCKDEIDRKCSILAEIDSIGNFIHKNFIFAQYKPDENIQDFKDNVEMASWFMRILSKEDNKTIIPEDYSSYLEKYPDAYYKQYCIDGYAMAKADTFTLDTPKDEIKKLLDSGISKGAAKYVKMVTKKSYLKSKSL